MARSKQNPKVTVFIPTWYGEDYLDECLEKVFSQKTPFSYEVLIFDTSSADATPDIIKKFARKHKNLRHATITKQEFSHGATRQRAALEALGDIVVYLTQDATPVDERWLYEIVKPFELNPRIAGVVGKQTARPKAFPLLKREIRAVFAGMGPDTGTTLYYHDDFIQSQQQLDHAAFYSDVNSAARKSVLLGDVPYKEVDYAEDQLFGRDLIANGYIKAYAPRADVLHSNEFSIREYKNRMFDEIMGLRKNNINVEAPSMKAVVRMVVTGSVKDMVSSCRDREYSLKRKLYYIITAPLYHIQKWRGVRRAVATDFKDDLASEKHSLESLQHKRR